MRKQTRSPVNLQFNHLYAVSLCLCSSSHHISVSFSILRGNKWNYQEDIWNPEQLALCDKKFTFSFSQCSLSHRFLPPHPKASACKAVSTFRTNGWKPDFEAPTPGNSLFQKPLVFLVVRLPQDSDHVTSASHPMKIKYYIESNNWIKLSKWCLFLMVKTGECPTCVWGGASWVGFCMATVLSTHAEHS